MFTLTLLTTGSLTTSERHAKLISVDMRDKGGWYMSPFWNHILAKSGRFIHVSLQISWYVHSMYLGTQGDFFSDLYIFCALLPRCCVLLCGGHFAYVCTLPTLILRAHLPHHFLEWPCVHLPHQHWTSAITTPGVVSLFTIQPIAPNMTSYLQSIHTPYLHCCHWIHMFAMPSRSKRSPHVSHAF
jgi:hypothetical protein